jgi:hypothetical protein
MEQFFVDFSTGLFGVSKNMIAVRTAKAEGSDAACRPHFAHF